VAPYQHFGPFSVTALIRQQPELCRVIVNKTSFPWLRLYPQLIQPNPKARQEGVAGYELVLNYAGSPFQLIPRAPSEIPDASSLQLISVNETVQENFPCRKLVTRQGRQWALTAGGKKLLDMLTFE
jgi:hypothetical protein